MLPGASADIVVIGGGIIGLAAAWRTASDGADVVVVDPRPGHGATWAAAGMLGPVGEAHFGEEPLARLNVTAARRWPGFAVELEAASGLPVAYLPTGTVMAAMDTSDRRWIDDLLAYQVDLGLDARRLSASGCRALEPLLSPGVRGGAEFRSDHQVDNRQVVGALVEACARTGVTMVTDQAVAIEVTDGRVCGVSLAGGDRTRTETVVLAAGSQSGQLAGVPESCLPPVRPVKGLTLRLRVPPAGPSLGRTVRGLVHGRTSYLVPREDGSVVVGATMEERGFDTTVQAGAVHGLLSDARQLVPALDEYVLEEMTVGWRPGTPDNAPIVGWTSLDGLLVATGHFRNGILLAPETARAVAALVQGGEVDATMAPFGPGRFGSEQMDRPETAQR